MLKLAHEATRGSYEQWGKGRKEEGNFELICKTPKMASSATSDVTAIAWMQQYHGAEVCNSSANTKVSI